MAATTAPRRHPNIRPGELRIWIRELGTTVTIELDGEWDLAQAKATNAAVTEALSHRPECLVLDLSRVSFIDSSAVHGVVQTSKRCSGLGLRLVIIPGPRQVQGLFELCGLSGALPFAPANEA